MTQQNLLFETAQQWGYSPATQLGHSVELHEHAFAGYATALFEHTQLHGGFFGSC